jgi:hypothetical protein
VRQARGVAVALVHSITPSTDPVKRSHLVVEEL